ncbi:MAG: hypothetical protein EOO10_03410 [Chitinophagaceae bacterium]|nr:MAG: hypothetical protein EOO10_03410 [Chitinophagaceae bacterium]
MGDLALHFYRARKSWCLLFLNDDWSATSRQMTVCSNRKQSVNSLHKMALSVQFKLSWPFYTEENSQDASFSITFTFCRLKAKAKRYVIGKSMRKQAYKEGEKISWYPLGNLGAEKQTGIIQSGFSWGPSFTYLMKGLTPHCWVSEHWIEGWEDRRRLRDKLDGVQVIQPLSF